MRNFEKSTKLNDVCYDIRGPVMDEANRMQANGIQVLKLNIGNPAPFHLYAPDEIIVDMIYNLRDTHSQAGVVLSLGIALLAIFFISDPFQGLIISQMLLSIQLPFTIFLQVGLTSSPRVMGEYANSPRSRILLYSIAAIVSALNLYLFYSAIAG